VKHLYLTMYRFHDGLDEDDLKKMAKKFLEVGGGQGIIAHYSRLDGKGGFIIQDIPNDPEKDYENTIQYTPFMDMEVVPITTIEDAFPVFLRVYG